MDAGKSRDVKVAEQATVEYADGALRIRSSAKNQYFGPSGASEQGSIDLDEAASARLTAMAGDVSVGRLRTDAGEVEVGGSLVRSGCFA